MGGDSRSGIVLVIEGSPRLVCRSGFTNEFLSQSPLLPMLTLGRSTKHRNWRSWGVPRGRAGAARESRSAHSDQQQPMGEMTSDLHVHRSSTITHAPSVVLSRRKGYLACVPSRAWVGANSWASSESGLVRT